MTTIGDLIASWFDPLLPDPWTEAQWQRAERLIRFDLRVHAHLPRRFEPPDIEPLLEELRAEHLRLRAQD